ncbi:MAG: sigma-70 family RNA polymerase sigma factor [Planctomycetales bacterium]|nr:sigma-70 family RNA polymerase sigma factor [Planctomycetales bacterium]
MPLTDHDQKLLTDLLNTESGAWKLFVDRYTPLVVQVIQHTAHSHSLKLNADDAEDLCADTMTELLVRDMAALRSFRGRCSLATYLGVITRRIVVRRLAEHRFSSALGHVNAHHAAVDFASTDNSSVQQLEHRDQVESLLSKLPQEPRQLAKWLFLDELSYLEISQRLAKPLNSIGPLVSRLRSLLQRCDSFPLAKK